MGDTLPRWLSREEVARQLTISVRTLQRMERSHHIPTRRVGGQIRYDDAALAALEAACPSNSSGALATKVYGLPAPSPLPARRKVSGSAVARDLISQLLRQKSSASSKPRSSGTRTSANVLQFEGGAKP
ncbi:helix-turn-helix domain-containing protein [Roseococcus sp. XZZS9]|uniref:Helix-turn-helix domain-containing protein n=1 Tax=Roseococcus pinisoli TaxID=2835040 RepID=A0ABS5QBU8_9PROT|nr:helix-turn-helix domain-containing protein [Roseococcus pinisoli]